MTGGSGASPAQYVTTTTAGPVRVTAGADWEAAIIRKVAELRRTGKRAILLVDGSRVFVFSAEPRGVVPLE